MVRTLLFARTQSLLSIELRECTEEGYPWCVLFLYTELQICYSVGHGMLSVQISVVDTDSPLVKTKAYIYLHAIYGLP